MRYHVLSKQGVDVARTGLTSRAKIPNLGSYEILVGSGEALSDSNLDVLAARIRKVQLTLGREKAPPEELDRRCFELVHESLPRDELLMLADPDFWTHFAVTRLSEIIYARFPGRKGGINLDNFGLGARKECWPYKLWVRGELAFDASSSDKYALGRNGGVDIWTSHVHRQNFMTIPALFRGVLKFQYPKSMRGKPLLFEGEEDPAKKGVPGFRTLIKRLRENWASVEYVCLTDREAEALVRIHSKGLHRADDKSLFKQT